jgi:hypothetical protein
MVERIYHDYRPVSSRRQKCLDCGSRTLCAEPVFLNCTFCTLVLSLPCGPPCAGASTVLRSGLHTLRLGFVRFGGETGEGWQEIEDLEHEARQVPHNCYPCSPVTGNNCSLELELQSRRSLALFKRSKPTEETSETNKRLRADQEQNLFLGLEVQTAKITGCFRPLYI